MTILQDTAIRLRPIFEQKGVLRATVFGSLARGSGVQT
jgi:predicted nucleotidyltransferase